MTNSHRFASNIGAVTRLRHKSAALDVLECADRLTGSCHSTSKAVELPGSQEPQQHVNSSEVHRTLTAAACSDTDHHAPLPQCFGAAAPTCLSSVHIPERDDSAPTGLLCTLLISTLCSGSIPRSPLFPGCLLCCCWCCHWRLWSAAASRFSRRWPGCSRSASRCGLCGSPSHPECGSGSWKGWEEGWTERSSAPEGWCRPESQTGSDLWVTLSARQEKNRMVTWETDASVFLKSNCCLSFLHTASKNMYSWPSSRH